MSVTQTMEEFQSILENEVPTLARETGAVKRKRKEGLDSVTLVMTVIFGFWQIPDLRLSGLAQMMGRRAVKVSASAICQRFTAPTAELFRRVLQRFAQVRLQSDKVEIALFQTFRAVIVEDSSTIHLPACLAGMWQGCGGNAGRGEAALKIFVRWNVLTGQVLGPELTNARTSDHRGPFHEEDLVPGCLYLADLGFFAIKRLQTIARGSKGSFTKAEKRFFVTRWQPRTILYTRSGHRLDLKGLLPQQVGQVRELGVVLGKHDPLAIRLIVVKVPEDVANERRERMKETAQKHGRQPGEDVLFFAGWSIVLTNIARTTADFSQILVLLRLRWQIERLFRLWKEDGKIDEWRSKNPSRQLSEFSAKLCAMIMQQALMQEGCWLDPYRSIVKAAACIRHEINRLMIAFCEGGVHKTVLSILCCFRSGCQLDRRAAHPSTAQLLVNGLDWELELLLT
ncbi:IS4 family transposase [Dictyobacter arantiisoli]|uniref:IS4 family transposase n=1 Tax=Dictyobacter arantiisoli TaxID=2014874 RepID=A0A5A5TIC3_9CHLR|nr:IS4 family transposase [Dictyobacter arantiisoli]GCF10948.1 IS4 family transposase [Dictyobacter arantiisoli]